MNGMAFEELSSTAREFVVGHTQLLLESHRRLVGRDLLRTSSEPEAAAQALFEAPFAVLSGGTEADQILNYGNDCALKLWGMNWEELTCMPSRLTAEPELREARAALLERVRRDGYISDYRGVRIAKNGTRFYIENAVVWNLLDRDGVYCGQAATFAKWTDALHSVRGC